MQTELASATPAPRASAEEPWRKPVEAALAHAFRVALPRANACVSSRLGYSAPIYARQFSHGYETLFDIAKDLHGTRDLGAYFGELLADRTGAAGSWDRVAAELREERALRLVDHVMRLPQPQREVVLLRSVGVEWRRLTKMLPGRAYFSLMEDYLAALRGIWERADDLVSQIAH